MTSTPVHPLSNRWTLWYHDITEESWELSSYKKIYNINTLEDYFLLHNTIPTFTSGMFLLMKGDVSPRREDDVHRNGGFWTFKIPKKNANQIWDEVVGRAIGNTITANLTDVEDIVGLSISPKINNCIIKIWNQDKMKSNPRILVNNIRGLNLDQALYRPLHGDD
jgi:hypothetical protein